MGLREILTGRRTLAQPAQDRLFAISTAYVTFTTSLQITSKGTAAIVFQSLDTADFSQIVTDMEQVVRATASDTATEVQTSVDAYDFSWLILRQRTTGPGAAADGAPGGADFDGLVAGINAVSTALTDGGYGDRILCAVFAFTDGRDRPLYWIYNYKRGAFYPFVPVPGRDHARDNERELVLKAQVGSELPVEAELTRWFALWGIPI